MSSTLVAVILLPVLPICTFADPICEGEDSAILAGVHCAYNVVPDVIVKVTLPEAA